MYAKQYLHMRSYRDGLSDLSQMIGLDHVESYGCFYFWHTEFSAYIDKAMVADPYCPYLSNYDI